MRFSFIQPSGILKEYIQHYWTLETSDDEGEVCERVIPQGNLQLMFHYRLPFVVKTEGSLVLTQPRSLVTGMSNSSFDVSTCGESGVIAVSFYPVGACQFFRFSLDELENKSLDLRDIFYKQIAEVEEKLAEAENMSGRICIIEQFLLSRFKPVREADFLMVRQGVELIRQNKARLSTSDLSDYLWTSPKSLERKFASLLGKTPKQYMRLWRFQEIAKVLSKSRNIDFLDCMFRYGYFDQPHFIKDFKSFSGYTPSEFIDNCCVDRTEEEITV